MRSFIQRETENNAVKRSYSYSSFLENKPVAIVDLKDKLGKIEGLEQNILTFSNNSARDESLSALLALGFTKNSVDKVLNNVLKAQPDLGVEGLIKEALKNL